VRTLVNKRATERTVVRGPDGVVGTSWRHDPPARPSTPVEVTADLDVEGYSFAYEVQPS
jgi:hypothetical protein